MRVLYSSDCLTVTGVRPETARGARARGRPHDRLLGSRNANAPLQLAALSGGRSRWLAMLAPKDPGRVIGDFIEQSFEVPGSRKRLIRVPAQIAVLTVQPPQPLGANVAKLGHRHLVPLLRSLEPGSLFEQDDLVRLQTEPKPQSVADGRRHVR